jgi:hypothetical protein
MSDETFEMPDMDALSRQLQDAMGEAERAMEDLPGELADVLGELSGLMEGLPADAAETLQLSPEAGIPLAVNEEGLSLELAPMGQDVVVGLQQFEDGEPFSVSFQPSGQEEDVSITPHFTEK